MCGGQGFGAEAEFSFYLVLTQRKQDQGNIVSLARCHSRGASSVSQSMAFPVSFPVYYEVYVKGRFSVG